LKSRAIGGSLKTAVLTSAGVFSSGPGSKPVSEAGMLQALPAWRAGLEIDTGIQPELRLAEAEMPAFVYRPETERKTESR